MLQSVEILRRSTRRAAGRAAGRTSASAGEGLGPTEGVSPTADRMLGEEDFNQWPCSLKTYADMPSWRRLVEASIAERAAPYLSVY